jgi:hypothetical protein
LAGVESAVNQVIFVFIERVSGANVIGEKLAEVVCGLGSAVFQAHSVNTKRLERVGQITFVVKGAPACYPAIFAI